MFDPRRPTPTTRKTRSAPSTRSSDKKKSRRARPVISPEEQAGETLLDRKGIDQLFVPPEELTSDGMEERHKRKSAARRASQMHEDEVVVEEAEPMVADKDGSVVRQYFMEEAVVVEGADELRPPPTPPPVVTVDPAPVVQVPAVPILEPEKSTRRRKERRQEDIAVVAPPEPIVREIQTEPVRTKSRGRAFFPAAAAVLLLIVAFLLYLLGRQQVETRARADIERVSEEFIVAFTTFNHDSIGQQSSKVKELSVGGFREDYLGLVNDDSYRKFLTDLQGNSSGKVISLAVDEIREDQAKVIAFVDVTTVNKDRPDPQVVANRFELTLVRTAQGWKVDDLAFL